MRDLTATLAALITCRDAISSSLEALSNVCRTQCTNYDLLEGLWVSEHQCCLVAGVVDLELEFLLKESFIVAGNDLCSEIIQAYKVSIISFYLKATKVIFNGDEIRQIWGLVFQMQLESSNIKARLRLQCHSKSINE